MPKNRDHYIQIDKDLMDDPLLLEAAARIYTDDILALQHAGGEELSEEEGMQLSRARYVSALLRLWCYADTYINDDDTLPMSEIALDQYVGLKGFCRLSPREWLEELPDGRIRLPGYCEKNDIVGRRERKAQRAEYMRNWRNGSRDDHATATKQPRNKHVPLNTYTNTKEEKDSLRSSKKKATRLPHDWRLPPEWQTWAIGKGLTPAEATEQGERFADYWLANPDGTKLDWLATWRNWIRKAIDDRHRGRSGTGHARPARQTQESAQAALDAAYREESEYTVVDDERIKYDS